MDFDRDYFEGRTSYFYQFGGYRDVGLYFNRLARWFRRRAGDGPLLDFGCAYGFLLARFDDGRDLHGCDISPWAIQKAKQRVPGGQFRLIDTDGPLPYDDRRFASVLCTDVIEHIPVEGQPAILRELVRVLAPGGQFCMTTPNLNRMRRLLYCRADRVEEHVGMRTLADWRRELPRHGLQVTSSWTYLNGFLPGRTRGAWLPECAIMARKTD